MSLKSVLVCRVVVLLRCSRVAFLSKRTAVARKIKKYKQKQTQNTVCSMMAASCVWIVASFVDACVGFPRSGPRGRGDLEKKQAKTKHLKTVKT